MVTIPRRKIQPHFHSILMTSIHKLTYQIAFSIFPRRILHTVFRISRRPQTKPVMMLGSKDHSFQSRFFTSPYPLTTVQLSRIKDGRGLIAIPPLHVRISIHAKMNKCRCFHLLPLQLYWCRYWQGLCLYRKA